MPCPRCRGLMVPDQFGDLQYDGGYWSFQGWRCLCCGNILDPVIIRNQQAVMMKEIGNTFLAGEDHGTVSEDDAGLLVSSAT